MHEADEIEQESQIDDGDSNNGDTHSGHSHEDDEKRSSLSLVTTSLWKEHPVTTNNNHTTRFKISSKKMLSSPNDSPLHDSPLHDFPLHDSHLHDSLQLDSNEFCTTLRLPGRVYEAVETPDNPKAIIHHSKIDYVEKVEDILGKEEFSLIENSHIGSILKVSSPTPTFTSPKFDLLSQESHSGKVAEKYWLGVVVNLEKRSITTFNCAAMKFTDASLVPYVNAYAMALPFMIHNFFKDVSMNTSKFSIKIVSEGFPQVLKIEDSGVYALKLIECHAMGIMDLTKLSEEKIAIIREKLAVDIFSELQ
ncbi:hypothetical protein F2Q68_00033624 [Brassica cretica]|uniref:Ubiquitin-like protease family profile domain-containing protein n=1 Tax=Brassica cretica TaxID=69181 RepID=A0A8S9H5R9_BRACR|nr:hypothetical protein F2Q68_00033624 [Brassica cretica]